MRRTDRPATDISKFAAAQVSDVRRAEITNAVTRQQDAKDMQKTAEQAKRALGNK
jgi:hypothetical protein